MFSWKRIRERFVQCRFLYDRSKICQSKICQSKISFNTCTWIRRRVTSFMDGKSQRLPFSFQSLRLDVSGCPCCAVFVDYIDREKKERIYWYVLERMSCTYLYYMHDSRKIFPIHSSCRIPAFWMNIFAKTLFWLLEYLLLYLPPPSWNL